jgi:hypothetical protein
MFERYKKFGFSAIDEDELQNAPWEYGSFRHLIDPLWGTDVGEWFDMGNQRFFYDPSKHKHIETFEDIRGRAVPENAWVFQAGYGTRRIVRIVGMINFDLSGYEFVANQDVVLRTNATNPQDRITNEHLSILRRADSAKRAYLNNFFALPDFMRGYTERNAVFYLQGGPVTASLTHPEHESTQRIMANPLPHGLENVVAGPWYGPDSTTLRPGYSWEESKNNKRQTAVTANLLWVLLPDDVQEEYLDLVDEWMPFFGHNRMAALHAVTHHMIVNDNILDGAYLNLDIHIEIDGVTILRASVHNFEIVAVHMYWSNSFFPSQDFYDDLVIMPIGSLLVPVASHEQRMAVVNTLADSGRFAMMVSFENEDGEVEEEERVYSFVVWSENAREIYALESMFMLFVSVFRLAAILFCLFAVLLTYSFIAASINARKRDIGILRSLGAGRGDVVRIFTKEGIFIAVLEIIFACVVCFLGYYFLNRFFISQLGYIAEAYTLVTFGIRQILLMALVTIIGVAVSIALPIIRIARKQPVEVIREVQ